MRRLCKRLRTRFSLCTCAARFCSVVYVFSTIDAGVTLAWVVVFCPVATLARFVAVDSSCLMGAVFIMSVFSGTCTSLDLLVVTDTTVFCDLLEVDGSTIAWYRSYPFERLRFMRVRSVLIRPSICVIAVVKNTTRSWFARVTCKPLFKNVRMVYFVPDSHHHTFESAHVQEPYTSLKKRFAQVQWVWFTCFFHTLSEWPRFGSPYQMFWTALGAKSTSLSDVDIYV